MVALALAAFVCTAEIPWRKVGDEAGVAVFQRERADAGGTETMGVGVVDMPPLVVKNALDDYEAKDGAMPYLVEMRVLRRDATSTLIYHRTSPPLIADRDYTIRMWDESATDARGEIVYVCRWRTANAEGPPPRDGVVRVDVTEGYWQLEPIDGGKRTRATYRAFATPGGAIPDSLAAWGTASVVGKIFDAIRVRAKNPHYARAAASP
jgi:hypothetical protein